jgi:hypothetical protein
MVFANTVSVEEMLHTLTGNEPLRVWLDDDLKWRKAADDWVHTTTVAQTVALLDQRHVIELSLDNDLGDDAAFGQGKFVVDYLCEQQEVGARLLWPQDGLTIHSANANARDEMTRAIERYASTHLRVQRLMTQSGKRRFLFHERTKDSESSLPV